MPYPNEHSARLQDPKKCDPKSFRRKDNGKLFGRITVPKTIAIIWAKLKGKAKPKDPVVPQALRFPTKHWTAAKAKTWLSKNKVGYTLFEAASSKNKQSDAVEVRACVFSGEEMGSTCEVFAAQDEAPKRFKIVGYSGKPILGHWYWGNVGFDLDGMEFYKTPMPVLEEHLNSRRVGFTTSQEIDKTVHFEGEFLPNENAGQLHDDMKAGFPMEASLYLQPTIIERIAEGASSKCNGHTIKGPGTVFRKSVCKEVSVCVFGADSHTKSLAAAEGEKKIEFNVLHKENEMEPITFESLTAEELGQNRPDLVDEIRSAAITEGKADGEKAAVDRFAAIAEIGKDDPKFVVEHFKAGKTADEAKDAMIAKLRSAPAPAGSDTTASETGAAADPASQEFTDSAEAAASAEGPKTFEDGVEARVKADTSGDSDVRKKARATRFMVKHEPKLHQDFLKRQREEAEKRADAN